MSATASALVAPIVSAALDGAGQLAEARSFHEPSTLMNSRVPFEPRSASSRRRSSRKTRQLPLLQGPGEVERARFRSSNAR